MSFGCSNDPIFPPDAINQDIFSLSLDNLRFPGKTDAFTQTFDFIAKESLDHIFATNRIFMWEQGLKELASKLKIGGHIILHVAQDPQLIESIREKLRITGFWQEKDTYFQDEQFLGIWKLLARNRTGIMPPKPKAAKRALIARYGAIGDMIMISPLIRKLKQDGYEVTMNITPYCVDVIKYNPNVDNILLQERDIIPNADLGPYWNTWLPEYDKYINLSESIEGKLLKVEGRNDFYTTKEWRNATCGSTNYYDQTMRLGGYPEITGSRGELFFSRAEEKAAQHIRDKFKGKQLILWGLKGSSHHKIYPLLEPLLSEYLRERPNVHVLLSGAPADAPLQFQHPQVTGLAGQISLRDAFCLTKYVDLVVGPESALINAAACFDTPKLTFLTHSTHDNLCKYWTNDFCMTPEGVSCYPCNQLHYSKESCPLIQICEKDTQRVVWDGPVCAGMGFAPDRVIPRLDAALHNQKPASQNP